MRRGFTLVEIMIVVAVITLLALVSIPNVLRARVNANETAAIAALRTIAAACEGFRAAQQVPIYPPNLLALSNTTPPYIDTTLANATTIARARQGYRYIYTRINRNQYRCYAYPARRRTTGNRYFYLDERGIIRTSTATGSVGPNSTPIQ